MNEARIINFYPAHGLDSYTGYGRMELGIARGLQNAGVTILLYPDLAHPMLMVNSTLQLLDAPHVKGTRLWAFTMVETNKVDSGWVKKINETCERVLVPCLPMVEIYRQSGVEVAVDYVPLGVDLFSARFDPSSNGHSLNAPSLNGHEPAYEWSDGGGVFTFLTYSYGDVRKGADLAVQAFETAFENDPRFRLVIKAREGYQETWLAEINNPQIEIISGLQSETEWLALQRRAHCFVFASRGEGWGMPPRELTLAGVPTIATQWLGMWDVDQWGIPLKVKELRQCEFRDYQANARDGLWCEPDVDHLVTQMRWVVDHYAEARGLAATGREYLLEGFTWNKVGALLGDLVYYAKPHL